MEIMFQNIEKLGKGVGKSERAGIVECFQNRESLVVYKINCDFQLALKNDMQYNKTIQKALHRRINIVRETFFNTCKQRGSEQASPKCDVNYLYFLFLNIYFYV